MTEFHLGKPRDQRPWVVRMCETVYDITLNAQHMCETGRVEVEDSRDLFASIMQWAIEFEGKYPGSCRAAGGGTADYIDLIDEFAEAKLLESYGKEN